MLDKIPTTEKLEMLFGVERLSAWIGVCALIENLYEVPAEWDNGGKKWRYEYKYRRGGKTLCALYARENCFGFMVILGEEERKRFESMRENFSKEVSATYDEATTYHDGKWLMLDINNQAFFADITRLLSIKRRPNKKVISCCGVYCSKCEYYPNDCLGCPSSKGKPFWLEYTGDSICAIYNCCVNEKKQSNCGGCPHLPCSYYEKGDPIKSNEENKAILQKQLAKLQAMQ